MARPWKIGDLVEWRRKTTRAYVLTKMGNDYAIGPTITPSLGDRGMIVDQRRWVTIIHMFAAGCLIECWSKERHMRRVEVDDG